MNCKGEWLLELEIFYFFLVSKVFWVSWYNNNQTELTKITISFSLTVHGTAFLYQRAENMGIAEFPILGRVRNSRVRVRDTTFSSRWFTLNSFVSIVVAFSFCWFGYQCCVWTQICIPHWMVRSWIIFLLKFSGSMELGKVKKFLLKGESNLICFRFDLCFFFLILHHHVPSIMRDV